MGLLGMLAAGAGGGIRDASNASVQAQNQLEIEAARENLREEFYSRRYNRERADQISDAKSQGLLNQAAYERDRANKLADEETKHTRSKEIEGIKTSRSAASNAARIQAAEIRKSGAAGKGGSGIMLSSGLEFKPNSPEYKLAADMVATGDAVDINDAINIVLSKNLVSQAAGSIQGLTEGIVPTAKDMSRQLFGSGTQAQDIIQETIRDPKTGRLILK